MASCRLPDMVNIPPARRVIRLFPDYSRDWPLWENSTPTWDVGYTTTPDIYGLSEDLTRDMAAWNTLWEENFVAEVGWTSDDARAQWQRDGLAIAERLDRKSTRLNSSHVVNSYAVFCLIK